MWRMACGLFHFLSDDMHVYRRCISEEFVDRRKVKVFSPTGLRGSAKDNLGDVPFAHEFGDSFRDISARGSNNLGADILCEFHVLFQGPAIGGIVIATDIYIDDEQLRINALRHPRGPGDQVLGSGAGTDLYGDAPAPPDRFL